MIPVDLRYFTIPDDDEVQRRIVIQPQPITSLAGYGISEGAGLIEAHMRSFYTVTPQIIHLVQEVCGIGSAYLKSTYTDLYTFQAKCNTESLISKDPRTATAVTGLGGVGKTQLLRAVARLVTPEGAQFECPNLPAYPVQGMWILTMVAGMSMATLLEFYVAGGGDLKAILKAAAKRAFTNGVGLISLDESQFITATQQGHAKAAELLMRLTYIGPPFVYAANFTMINKLRLRPNQERDRLLSNVIVQYPEEYGSDAHQSIVTDQLVVLSEAVSGDSAISAKNHAHEIHNFTYGINRKSAILLTHAWQISRERGSSIITMDDVRRAYQSDKFSSHRVEVEILKSQSIGRRMVREDLWCDFAPPTANSSGQFLLTATNPNTTSSDNVICLPEATEEKEKRVANEMARETMSKSEREAYDLVASRRAKMAKPKAPVVRIPRVDKSLSALQLAGTEMLERFSPKA